MKNKFLVRFLLASTLTFCFATLAFGDTRLPNDEEQALRDIAKKLGKTGWNFSVDPCSGQSGWVKLNQPKGFEYNVTCNCSFPNDTACHVVTILLKGLNLSGVLPTEFGNLPYLQQLDLSRNYISGPIPTSFARLPALTNLSLLGNRLNGRIPTEIGDIGSLLELVLEDNQLGGPLPENLGKLSNLKKLRIDGTKISGKIPDFIGNWSKLNRLDMQGTSMEGPIPSSISLLTNLTELRISDLNGPSNRFPNLQNLKDLKYLVLRNCLITSSIPAYIFEKLNLKRIDLSFNNLSGPIPEKSPNKVPDYM